MNLLIKFLNQKTGFDLHERNKEKILSLLKDGMRSNKMNTERQYLDYIRSPEGHKELENLISDITVNESYFFRNTDHWHALSEFVLPALIKLKKKSKSIKIWSAGCSTGEEPYTIAIYLCEFPDLLNNFEINILATDIDNAALDKARQGLYTANSFRGEKNHLTAKYFSQKNNQFKLNKNIQDMVDFDNLNIISAKGYPAKFFNCDIVFCRNTLMYLKPQIQKDTVKRLASHLNAEGFFFFGHAELSLARNTKLNPINCCNTFVFQKTGKKLQKETIFEKQEHHQDLLSSDLLQPDISEKDKPVQDQEADFTNAKNILDPETIDVPPQENTAKIQGIECYNEAFEYYLKEDFQFVIKTLLSKEEQIRLNIEELILCALSYLGMLDYEQADLYIQKAFKISKTIPEIYMTDAILKETAGDIDGAVKSNQAAIFLDQSFFAAHFRLGHIYHSQGNNSRAHKHFKNAKNVLETDKGKRVKLFCGEISFKTLKDVCSQLL